MESAVEDAGSQLAEEMDAAYVHHLKLPKPR